MRNKSIILVLAALVIAISCDNKKGLLPAKTVPIAANVCDSIRYSNAAKSIFDNNCIQCHSSPFANGGADLSTYAGASGKADRIKDRITNTNNPMPPSGLMPQPRVDSIMCWINKGAPL